MLNGHVTPTQDDYTFVSTRGLSVVDYVLVPQHSVNSCHYFKVDCMSDILTKLNLFICFQKVVNSQIILCYLLHLPSVISLS